MAYKYDSFDIAEVAQKCGIVFNPQQKSSIEIEARCPFCDDRKYHLGINRNLERFHCFKCGEKGNSVSLYAKLYGVSNKEAYHSLKENIDSFDEKIIYLERGNEQEVRPLKDRHNVYYDMLNMLSLNRTHFENLLSRGLSPAHIHRFMYKSLPLDKVRRREVVEKLSKMHDLNGIPGFFKDNLGVWQMYYHKYGGIFIPVCDKEGYIQGLQIRLDLPEGSTEKKFRWFSSRFFNEGTAARSWIHVVGDTNAKEACITEGAMKGDIVSVLTNGRLFIAVPGVNSIANLPGVIRDLGITKVYESFDMDKRSKPEVKRALISLRNTLDKAGVQWQSCSWNPKYKGLDDYFLAKTLSMKNAALVAA